MAKNKLNFSKYTISAFLKELGSSAPYPGGGSGAGLAGSVGLALIEMVTRINAKRDPKNSAILKKQSQNKISTITSLRLKMERLITLDAKAFMRVSKYFKTKKESAAYQHALKVGAYVPLEICEVSAQALQIGILEKNRTSRWLASDLAEAGILLKASLDSARLNVEVNLKNISDKNFCSKVTTRLNVLDKKTAKFKSELMGILSR